MTPQREWFDTDYYAALGVSADASEKEITRAYRKLAKQYHPDANPGNKEAEDRFKEVSTANDVLSDPDKRKEYDRGGSNPFAGGNPFGGGGPGGGGPNFDPSGFSDILSNLLKDEVEGAAKTSSTVRPLFTPMRITPDFH